MTDYWDEDWERLIEDILSGRFSGGYIRRTNDYGRKEEGVIYASSKKEILDFDDYITITIDLYGVRDEDLNIKTKNDKMDISFMYDGIWDNIPTMRIPPNIDKNTIKTSFNNFILDIQMEKVKE
jgi:HSP20 family molecular chaperone IbpA